jgi:mannosyltransferase OCH1-like enzyme
MRTDELTTAQLSEAKKVMRRKFRNFKLRHDSEYRRLYLKALPKVIFDRLTSLFKS